jgi:hypothetical protein
MRLSLVAAVVALALFAPAAGARIDPPSMAPVTQNLSSPDAHDANAAKNAKSLQDLARLHAGNPDTAGRASKPSVYWSYGYQAPNAKTAAALAQEQYYSSYGRATTRHSAPTTADDDSPVLIIGLGLGLTFLIAGAVTMAVRTRRRVRLAV